jgi:hypothetical protein
LVGHNTQQIAEALSALANTTQLVTQHLQLPLGACAVITNGRMVWDHDPRDSATQHSGATASCVGGCWRAGA